VTGAQSAITGGLAAVGDLVRVKDQASDLVRRLPFCEPIPPLTDRRNPRSEQRHIKTQRCT
jgi:hypothetical protein